jgi:uncharacterized alpha/beta hydrolase family protein
MYKFKFIKRMKSWADERADMDIGGVIGVVVLVVIALLLLPLVQSSVVDAQNDANTSASASTLLGMVPIFYVLGVILVAVLWVVGQARKV